MKKFLVMLLVGMLAGCAVGHQDYVDLNNQLIGTKAIETKPFKFPDSGRLIRSDYLVAGEGLTHITRREQGELIYHYSSSEVLPHYKRKAWVGKCLIYYVVDPETNVIKAWGFEEGGNPLSCRTWP